MTPALFFALLLGTTPVQALGQAQVVAENRVAARDQALDAALKQAVDQAITYVLDPQTRLRAQAALKSQVLSHARTYVPTYRVLDEHEVSGGLFQVQIEAQVDTALLRKDATTAAAGAGEGGGGAGGGGGSRPSPGVTPPPARPRVLVATNGPVAAALRKAMEIAGLSEDGRRGYRGRRRGRGRAGADRRLREHAGRRGARGHARAAAGGCAGAAASTGRR
jgi:hypothetical protein